MKRIILMVLLSLAFASLAYAGAQWYPAIPRDEMEHRLYTNYCPYPTQCLVGSGIRFNESLNGIIAEYFTDPEKPRCINDGQYILDYYCDSGTWTTRTKLIALKLLEFANRNDISRGDYILYCDSYDKVFNNYKYGVSAGPTVEGMFKSRLCYNNSAYCFNNVCVLQYRGGTALGISLNAPIDDTDNSFLLAMNQSSATACSNVPSTAIDFTRCTNNAFYYNPALESVIYIPNTAQSLQQTSDYAPLHSAFIKPEFDLMASFVSSNLHSAASSSSNYSFFSKTSFFNRLYIAEKSGGKLFGFLELDQTDAYHNYFGIRYKGYGFGEDPCKNIFDPLRLVEPGSLQIGCKASQNDFTVIGKKTTGALGGKITVWQDLVSKLRPQ